jgi:hypothetical protein
MAKYDFLDAADRIQYPVPGRQEEPGGGDRSGRCYRSRTADRPGNESRSVLRAHLRRQRLRSKDGRGGDCCDAGRLATDGGHGLERRILAKNDPRAPAARGVLTIFVNALYDIGWDPCTGSPAAPLTVKGSNQFVHEDPRLRSLEACRLLRHPPVVSE